MNKGLLIVLSGPSGCGKGTVCERVLLHRDNISFSVSATTREKGEKETHGVEYFFISVDEFKQMIANNDFLEYNNYNGNYYGTPKNYVLSKLDEGTDIILDIETNGAANVKKQYPDCVSVFLLPPSMEELYSRLLGRKRESIDKINARFATARGEIEKADTYDYIVVNDDLDSAVKAVESIIESEKLKAHRNKNLIEDLLK